MRGDVVRSVRLALVGGCVCLASGCATIAGGGTHQSVSVSSTPAGATFTVKSSSGLQMAQGTTPQTVRLPRRNEYQVEITVPGYQPRTLALTKGLNGWMWGNLLIGWIPGFIVDFAGGAAHKLEPTVIQVSMETGQGPSGSEAAVAVVHPLDADGAMLREVRMPLTPVDAADAR